MYRIDRFFFSNRDQLGILGKTKKGETMGTQQHTQKIIGAAFRVHNDLGPGFLEKVYENALALELSEFEGLIIRRQPPIPVVYRDRVIGEYYSDLLVEGSIIIEGKAVIQIRKEHEDQLVHYLTATRIDHGPLINFGPSVEIKHKYRVYKRPGASVGPRFAEFSG
jgi:GxxExxY protein